MFFIQDIYLDTGSLYFVYLFVHKYLYFHIRTIVFILFLFIYLSLAKKLLEVEIQTSDDIFIINISEDQILKDDNSHFPKV